MGTVFLSYCREDAAFIGPFREALERRRVPIYLDVLEVQPGMRVADSIEDGMAKSGGAILFLSATYLRKGWTRAERRYFTSRMIRDESFRLVVVHLDGCEVPPLLEPILRNTSADAEAVARIFAGGLGAPAAGVNPEAREIPVDRFLGAQPDAGALAIADLIIATGSDARFRREPTALKFVSKTEGSVQLELILPIPKDAIEELAAARARYRNYQRNCAGLDRQISEGGLGVFSTAFEMRLETMTLHAQAALRDVREQIEQLTYRVAASRPG